MQSRRTNNPLPPSLRIWLCPLTDPEMPILIQQQANAVMTDSLMKPWGQPNSIRIFQQRIEKVISDAIIMLTRGLDGDQEAEEVIAWESQKKLIKAVKEFENLCKQF